MIAKNTEKKMIMHLLLDEKINYKNPFNLNFKRKKSLKDKTAGIAHYENKEKNKIQMLIDLIYIKK